MKVILTAIVTIVVWENRYDLMAIIESFINNVNTLV